MEKYKIATGIYWVHIPEVDLRILCGCPADAVKHCMKRGFIVPKEKDGIQFETGPNAILLSDVSIQNGSFTNLAEFPVLQMFYRQGIIIPGHPNNTGQKPMLIGLEEQVSSQMDYIYRGNYGLVSKEEMMETGIDEQSAEEMMRLKLKFAFNKIKKSSELIEPKIIDRQIVELKPGVYIRRLGLNNYQFIYSDDTVTVDLNLSKQENYYPPYDLSSHKTKREYFSIIHIGEGDGWDVTRPCMGSLLTFQGKIFLIDAGPHIMNTLVSLGICINEVEGIFHTHAHDDHFAGIPSLIRSGHKLKYYATPLVRSSVTKKLSALLAMDEDRFGQYFEIHDLVFDRWNNIDGLEVKPVFSPHPVETSIMFFRTFWEGGYRSYAHFADIVAFPTLEKMITDNPKENGVTRAFFERIKKQYHEPATIKKIDIGGGMIHGMAEDFVEDESERLLLSHTSIPLTNEQKEIGSNASFAMRDILIKAQQDYCMSDAFHYLQHYFTDVGKEGIRMLMNCPVETINNGSILIKQGNSVEHLYLLIYGIVEIIDSKNRIETTLSPGSIIGEMEGITGETVAVTYRAASYIRVLTIPKDIYQWFIKRYNLNNEIKRISENRALLRMTWLFGEALPSSVQTRVAQAANVVYWEKGTVIEYPKEQQLFLIINGKGTLYSQKHSIIDHLEEGDFFSEDSVITGVASMFSFKANTDISVAVIPFYSIQNIPIVQWKLFEIFERRLKIFKAHFQITWYDSYTVQIDELDRQHKELFETLSTVFTVQEEKGFGEEYREKLNQYFELLESHLAFEESIMTRVEYPRYLVQKNGHISVLTQISKYKESSSLTENEELAFMEALKEWLLVHTLIEDRKYTNYFRDKGIR